MVSVAAHVAAGRISEMLAAFEAGDVLTATRLHLGLMPVYTGIFRTQGVMTAKAALSQLGVIGRAVRPPLVDLTLEEADPPGRPAIAVGGRGTGQHLRGPDRSPVLPARG